MAPVAPTKANLIRLKRDLAFAREGHELLEQKREILVAELFGLTDRARDVQARADEALAHAYEALERAIVAMGEQQVARLAEAVRIRTDVAVSTRKVMGVAVPMIDAVTTGPSPYFGLGDSSFWVDETIRRFLGILDVLGRLAETQLAVLAFTREVKKTVRRVNALEKIALPGLESNIKFIIEVLEETDRQSLFVLKQIKARLERRRRGRPDG